MTRDGRPGYLWAIVQEWRDSMPYPPSERQIAKRLGVSPSALGAWKRAESFPTATNLRALAAEIGAPYERLLNAVLIDQGYRTPDKPQAPPPGREVRGA